MWQPLALIPVRAGACVESVAAETMDAGITREILLLHKHPFHLKPLIPVHIAPGDQVDVIGVDVISPDFLFPFYTPGFRTSSFVSIVASP